jgi:hypothetical protein
MFISRVVSALMAGLFTITLSLNANTVQLSKADGDRLQGKIDEIAKNGVAAPVTAKRTHVSENELNSYLTFNLKEKIPKGLTQPEVTFIGDGRLAGRVSVDFDEFNRQRNPRGFMDPFSYLSGRLPVNARGTLRASGGRGQFQFESADIRGLPLPKPLVQELVRFFSRTDTHPKGFDIDAPFELPAKIREIVVNRGEAVVVQ